MCHGMRGEKDSPLTYMDLTSCNLTDRSALHCLDELEKGCPKLSVFILDKNNLSNLHNNSRACKSLKNILAQSKSLQKISLRECQIQSDVAVHIAHGVFKKPSAGSHSNEAVSGKKAGLKELHLDKNNLGSDGMRDLAREMK